MITCSANKFLPVTYFFWLFLLKGFTICDAIHCLMAYLLCSSIRGSDKSAQCWWLQAASRLYLMASSHCCKVLAEHHYQFWSSYFSDMCRQLGWKMTRKPTGHWCHSVHVINLLSLAGSKRVKTAFYLLPWPFFQPSSSVCIDTIHLSHCSQP